jgi:hypothetical protein
MSMPRITCSLAALVFLFAAPAHAQDGQEAMVAAAERMQLAQTQAEAAAIRPGDEALECDALQAEMGAIGSSPEMQAFAASQGAWAQSQMDQANQARAGAIAQAGMGMAMGLASSFIPGLGMAQGLAMQAQAQAMQGQANQNQLEMATNMEAVTAMMPAMMRGQRVYQLAETKQCAFLQEQSAPPQ